MMNLRKGLSMLVLSAMLLNLTACGEKAADNPKENTKAQETASETKTDTEKAAAKKTLDRETVTVYCWGEHMIYSGYAAYVQSQIPEADVVFITGQNSMKYYEFMEDHDALPDILTVRRMSMIDAENLRDRLLDLSETEVAAGFNNIYLENYRFEDGSINWLPACGEVDGYIANLDLFEQYDIPLPTDRKSFNEVCEAFKEAGIIPYSNDFGMDYTCLETLQGLSIPELMKGDGIRWRTSYESGKVHELDDTIWPAAFERLEEQLKVWETPKEAAGYAYQDMADAFLGGKAALMRGTGNDVIAFKKKGMNVGMLPYFGDTEEENWFLTYPSFNVAVNKDAGDDPDRYDLCMKVLDVMFSEEAQNVLAGNHNMIPYNTGVTLELDESMQNIEPYISKNHLYLRLASIEIFKASYETVGKMVTGEYTAQQAYERFNELLGEGNLQEDEVVIHFDKGYRNNFDPAKGNEAASVMTNTLRKYFGSDIMIAHGVSYSGIVFESYYTLQQVKYMVTDTTIRQYTKELTGEKLKSFVNALLTEEYGGIFVINRYSLPVLSGCEMELSHDDKGYHLEKLTINGKEIQDQDTFTVTYIGSLYQAEPMLEELWKDEKGIDSWDRTDDCNVQQHWVNCILGSENNEPFSLEEPTDYLEGMA